MEELLYYRQCLLNRLAAVIDEMYAVRKAIPPEAWQTPADETGETRHQILAHLRDFEVSSLAVRLRRILDEDIPYLPLHNDEAWKAEVYKPDEQLDEILATYASLRQQELSWLSNLSSAQWNRTGRHPWYGIRTLQWWTEQCLVYAEDHLRRMVIS
jgi:hypothetical protein